MSKLGIANILALTASVGLLGTATGKIMADGAVNLKDLPHVDDVFAGLRQIGKVKFVELLPEVKDLDEAEAAQLAAKFSETFDLPGDSVELVVEQGFALLTKAVEAVMSLWHVGEKVKVPAA